MGEVGQKGEAGLVLVSLNKFSRLRGIGFLVLGCLGLEDVGLECETVGNVGYGLVSLHMRGLFSNSKN